jgi:hypothetical protein
MRFTVCSAIFCGLDDYFQATLNLLRIIRAAKELGATKNACERVVEIMRDAGSKFAECGQLFHLGKLFADSFLFGYVVRKLLDMLLRLFRRALLTTRHSSGKCDT